MVNFDKNHFFPKYPVDLRQCNGIEGKRFGNTILRTYSLGQVELFTSQQCQIWCP